MEAISLREYSDEKIFRTGINATGNIICLTVCRNDVSVSGQ
jgi:hypothetical protein